MNDAFIFSNIRFLEGDYAKRMSIEATTRVKELGGMFLQFKTFTYIRVVGSEVKLKNFPRYPCNHFILLEIAIHIETTYGMVKAKHQKTWSWPILIGPYE